MYKIHFLKGSFSVQNKKLEKGKIWGYYRHSTNIKGERNMKITEDMADVNETGLGEGKLMSEVMLSDGVKRQVLRWHMRHGVYYAGLVTVLAFVLLMFSLPVIGWVRVHKWNMTGLVLIGIVIFAGVVIVSVVLEQRSLQKCKVLEDTFFMCGYDEELHTNSYDWIRKERYFAIIHERYHGTIQEYRVPCSKCFFESRDYNKPMLLLKKGTPYFVVDMMM